ncbi:MAG TPA: hypothetical protein VGM77_05295 [Gemmatimonadales bacterium]
MHFIASLFGAVFTAVGAVITIGSAVLAFGLARQYVRNKLRFVDAVRSPLMPWVVAIGATILMTPVVFVLGIVHLVGFGTALIVGGASGLGTASGVKALKRGE